MAQPAGRLNRGSVRERAAAYLAVVVALAMITALIRGIQPPGAQGSPAGSTMAMGFLILSATLLGVVAESVRLPRITGYLLAGLLFGPDILALITTRNLGDLSVINRFAIGIIAFIAGGELRPQLLRERGRGLIIILGLEMLAVLVLVAIALVALQRFVPFLAGRPGTEVLVLALLFASVATVHSPAVTIALLNETRAHGPVASTTLAVVVLADVVVVLLVTLAIAVAHTALGDGGFSIVQLGVVAWELIGAVAAGALLGTLIAAYLRHIGGRLIFFVIFVVFFGYEIATLLHVEFMLFMLAAGFFVENVSPVEGEPLIHAVEAISGPAYALFFALAGASIHLDELALLWPVALALVAVRAGAIRIGTAVGAALAGTEPAVRRLLWRGLISQAGVALGLATVAARELGDAGAGILTMFLAMIAIHELIGPLLFRSALAKAGELQLPESGRMAVPAGVGR